MDQLWYWHVTVILWAKVYHSKTYSSQLNDYIIPPSNVSTKLSTHKTHGGSAVTLKERKAEMCVTISFSERVVQRGIFQPLRCERKCHSHKPALALPLLAYPHIEYISGTPTIGNSFLPSTCSIYTLGMKDINSLSLSDMRVYRVNGGLQDSAPVPLLPDLKNSHWPHLKKNIF